MAANLDTLFVNTMTALSFGAPVVLVTALVVVLSVALGRAVTALALAVVALTRRARAAYAASIDRDVERMIADLNTRAVDELMRRPVPTDTQYIPRVTA